MRKKGVKVASQRLPILRCLRRAYACPAGHGWTPSWSPLAHPLRHSRQGPTRATCLAQSHRHLPVAQRRGASPGSCPQTAHGLRIHSEYTGRNRHSLGSVTRCIRQGTHLLSSHHRAVKRLTKRPPRSRSIRGIFASLYLKWTQLRSCTHWPHRACL